MNQIHNPYAFPTMPVQYERDGKTYPITDGMTLRDYFAAKAMQGLIACPNSSVSKIGEVAKASYAIADFMLEARK